LPELEDVATDQQTGGLAVALVIDRVTASRFGIAPTTIDNTLYDAFGQRQISTMYTQVNQYHVILESEPQFQKDPNKLNHLYIQSNASREHPGRARPRHSPPPGCCRRFQCPDYLRPVHAVGQYLDSSSERAFGQRVDFKSDGKLQWRDQFDHQQRRTVERLRAL